MDLPVGFLMFFAAIINGVAGGTTLNCTFFADTAELIHFEILMIGNTPLGFYVQKTILYRGDHF